MMKEVSMGNEEAEGKVLKDIILFSLRDSFAHQPQLSGNARNMIGERKSADMWLDSCIWVPSGSNGFSALLAGLLK